MRKVATKDNLADIMTKSLPTTGYAHLGDGMVGGADSPNPQHKYDRAAELDTWCSRATVQTRMKARGLERRHLS